MTHRTYTTYRTAVAAALVVGVLIGAARPCGAGTRDQVQVAELSPKAEQGINQGLRYLATHQNPDGSWGRQHHVAITSLSLMAFMLQGHFPKRGEHGAILDKGLAFLLKLL